MLFSSYFERKTDFDDNQRITIPSGQVLRFQFDVEGSLDTDSLSDITTSNEVAVDLKLVTYLVEVQTSNIFRGGTEAIVYVYLYGDKGVSGKWIILNKQKKQAKGYVIVRAVVSR